jgi:hypothetical protein
MGCGSAAVSAAVKGISVTGFHWRQLPARARTAVEARAGPVERAVSIQAGSVAGLTAILHTDSGEVFCKATHETHRLAWLHRREAELNPHLPAFVPRLRWHVEAAGWILLGFDRARGRHLDVTPGSPDLLRLARHPDRDGSHPGTATSGADPTGNRPMAGLRPGRHRRG